VLAYRQHSGIENIVTGVYTLVLAKHLKDFSLEDSLEGGR
jgi:hypothetical protein